MRAATERRHETPVMVRSLSLVARLVEFAKAATALGLCRRSARPSRALQPIFYVPSAPDNLISTLVGIWMAIALVIYCACFQAFTRCTSCVIAAVRFPRARGRAPTLARRQATWPPHRLMICDAVPGATVLGLQRPCIAIPSTLAQALTADELDQVILHEHAHVQRRDDWSRLAQALLMSVLWIHPASVLVSRALNREREMACDEWVVACTGLPRRTPDVSRAPPRCGRA